ncbi:hypothetical protein FEM48_Zijuj10G0125100 [Ziziphus jujuba var. spinosa]|uniref:Anaphase-promoting complex subunit 4-like WD40 domain-containing protein n=1 Tax=Ziziphus jujuba var. spinosa TaxID=714518 RepID=A0A978UNE2_ZIZJJ|nr:hypothetical protein FEM48_Zijuj10G0125100 [Ziziphus jujuba var. spinosa]
MSSIPDPPNYKKYGVPFYSVAWVPYKSIRFHHKSEEEQQQNHPDQTHSDTDGDNNNAATAERNYVVSAGGGGAGNSGIRNAIILSQFDYTSNSLSDQPVDKHETDSDLPYRMAVHPGGDGLVCSFPESCRLFEWNRKNSNENDSLVVKPSEKVLTQLEDVGQQLALKFNNDGSVFAAGGEDGKLRVFKWPSMEIILNEDQAHTTVKDLHFSHDGKLLVSLGGGGPCRVWDVTSSSVVTSLRKQNDEIFCACRFALSNDGNHVLYIAAVTGKGGSIVKWNTTTWNRIVSKPIVRDAISAFDVSADGKLLACGTTQGDVWIVNSASMRIQQVVRKAHLGLVTALRFSNDSRALASASMDSSVRVTTIEEEKKTGGSSLWIILFIILLAIAAYFLKDHPDIKSFITQM